MKKISKILFVDDDDTFEFIVKTLFKIEGINSDLIYKNRAKKALDFLVELDNTKFPDLIFLDINMPVIDGFEFLEQYKELKLGEKNKDTIIAMLSSSVYQNDVNRARSYDEVKDFVTKPLNMGVLNKFCEKHNLTFCEN